MHTEGRARLVPQRSAVGGASLEGCGRGASCTAAAVQSYATVTITAVQATDVTVVRCNGRGSEGLRSFDMCGTHHRG